MAEMLRLTHQLPITHRQTHWEWRPETTLDLMVAVRVTMYSIVFSGDGTCAC
jgi:hypothetical protein